MVFTSPAGCQEFNCQTSGGRAPPERSGAARAARYARIPSRRKTSIANRTRGRPFRRPQVRKPSREDENRKKGVADVLKRTHLKVDAGILIKRIRKIIDEEYSDVRILD